MRPSISFTCGLNSSETGETPRMTTFDGLSVPLLGRDMRTTSSFAANALPSRFVATPGQVSSIAACSLVTALCTSETAPLRTTAAFSGEPVSTSVFSNPSASMAMEANTNTTRAMPIAVSAVVSFLVHSVR